MLKYTLTNRFGRSVYTGDLLEIYLASHPLTPFEVPLLHLDFLKTVDGYLRLCNQVGERNVQYDLSASLTSREFFGGKVYHLPTGDSNCQFYSFVPSGAKPPEGYALVERKKKEPA